MTIKIMKKTTISEEEIQRIMDFEGLLKKNAAATKSTSVTRWILVSIGLIILSLATWQFWPSENKKPDAFKKESPKPQPSVIVAPVIIDKKDEKQGTVPPTVSQKVISLTKETSPKKEKPSMTVTAAVYHEAEPVAGFPALYEYLNKEIIYPSSGLKDSIQGVESVSFIIDENGRPDQIKVLHSLGKSFDEEAARLIRLMPEWKPATLDGKPVSSKVSLPVTFSIYKSKK
jgi:TonB family protein